MCGTRLATVVHRFSVVPEEIIACQSAPSFDICKGSGFGTYEFDGDLLVVKQVCAFEDYAKRAFSNLLADAVVHTHDVGGRGRHCGGTQSVAAAEFRRTATTGGRRNARLT
jgi:hypothetical protein